MESKLVYAMEEDSIKNTGDIVRPHLIIHQEY